VRTPGSRRASAWLRRSSLYETAPQELLDQPWFMVVLPKGANLENYLSDAVARHDHKAFQEAKQQTFKIRVGQQKQKKAK
jgi:hypothetical protein